MEVYIKNNKIENNANYDITLFDNNQPIIKFNKKHNKLYTIMIVDPDAPSYNNSIYRFWLHLLIVNNDDTIIKYQPPNPPKDSGFHRYYILIFEQYNKINNIINIKSRSNFDVFNFAKDNNIVLINKLMFRTKR